jgi:ParB family chromosome partitioning protein
MASSNRRLGRGLDSLISGGISGAPKATETSKPAKKAVAKKPVKKATAKKAPVKKKVSDSLPTPDGFVEIPITSVEPNPYQPRREMQQERVEELAESIRSEGLLQPIVVREVSPKKFQLIAGERRWRACQHLKLTRIPARIVKASEASAAVIAMIENLQRENLNPVEESLGYASLMRDFDLTQEAVAERVGKPRSSVANALRLLQLEREVQGYLGKGLLSVGHAKVLLGLEESEQQLMLARKIIERGISVRETERLVQAIRSSKPGAPKPVKGLSAQEQTAISDLQNKLGSFLNTKIQMKHSPKKGKIVIEYYGNEDLQRILEKIGI